MNKTNEIEYQEIRKFIMYSPFNLPKYLFSGILTESDETKNG